MRKLQLLFILLISIFYKSQDNSIAASVDTPVAYQTGVPDISYPLVSLPATKDFTLNFGISYNPNSYKLGEFCGQIARNWALSGSNFMITRKIVGAIDELLPPGGEWDDIYYYNINGEQGSFKFERTGTLPSNYVYKIIKLTPNSLKIESTKGQPESQNVYPFTIKDGKGYKYYFQDHNSRNMGPQNDDGAILMIVDTFYINKIEDPSGLEVATFQNKKFSISNTGGGTYTYMPEIISTNYGKIIIEHGDSGASWNFNDRYYFKNFTLKDHKNNFITKSVLDISNSSYQFFDIEMFQTIENVTIDTRYLNSIRKLDKSGNLIDKTAFNYNKNSYRKYGPNQYWWGNDVERLGIFTRDDPNFLLYGLLSTIRLPSGGTISYDFGTNQLRSDVDKNTPSYIAAMKDPNNFSDFEIQYLKKADETQFIQFDTKIKRIYPITGLGNAPNSRIYVRFSPYEIYPWPDNPGNPTITGSPFDPKLAYKVKNFISTNLPSNYQQNGVESRYSKYHYIVSVNGNPHIELVGSGGNGEMDIFEKFYTSPPYINRKLLTNSGVRIEKITYSENSQISKTLEFDYSLFNEPGVSSGKIVSDEEYETVIYKNVKVTESDKPGHTKYYYKIPDDFPTYIPSNNPNALYKPVFNFTKKGILDKKEIYTSSNLRVHLDEYGYIFPSYETMPVPVLLTENLIPTKITNAAISYDPSGNSLTETSERTFNQENNNLLTETKTSAEGIVSETIYQYAAEKGNGKLLGAGMFSVPLEVTQMQGDVQIGKLETKYDHAGNYFPSSVTSFGINNVVTGVQTNELYDSMGNVLQTRSKSGVPTAIIWGYGNTQPIAKIEGGEYFNILSLLGQPNVNLLDIVQRSNQDVDSLDNTKEQLLRDALEAFRRKPEFRNYLITTYTYDPLIGVKSVTSPNGMTEYYYYDSQNRMIRVEEDTNHNIIKENKYLQNLYTN